MIRKVIQNESPAASANIFAVGDCLISRLLYDKYNTTDQYVDIVENIVPYMDCCDLKIYNQESPICGEFADGRGLKLHPTFSCNPCVADAMIASGFNAVNLANNHTLDMEVPGVLNSLNYWKKYEDSVTTIGSSLVSNKPKKLIINGIGIGLVGYTHVYNDRYVDPVNRSFRNDFAMDKVVEDVAWMKENGLVSVVYIHWDHEYLHEPGPDTIALAKWMSEIGVDIIIGGHSHSIQPIEWIGNTLVVYSLGNFIASQTPDDELKRVGMMVKINIAMDGIRPQITPYADLIYMKQNPDGWGYKLTTQICDPDIIDWEKYYKIVGDVEKIKQPI